MDQKRFGYSEAIGCVVIYLMASVLHFVYPLSGGATLAIIFGAVNESVWEHVKIFSTAYIGWALIQLLWLRVPFRRYVVAKCAGLYLLSGGIVGFFYLYTAFTGRAILIVDLIASAITVCLAQFCSYRLTVCEQDTRELFAPALMLLMLYYLMFFSFTVFPPRLGMFRDPITGGYGIPA